MNVSLIISDPEQLRPVRVADYEIPPVVGDTLWHQGYRQALKVTSRHWISPGHVVLHARPLPVTRRPHWFTRHLQRPGSIPSP
jgi:hypothetical protein